jgi:hypothetical protein
MIVKQGKGLVINYRRFSFSSAYKAGNREISVIPTFFVHHLAVIVTKEPGTVCFTA